MAHRKFHVRFHIAKFAAAIIARAFETVGQYFFVLHQGCNTIGQLNFPTFTGFYILKAIKYLWRQYIATNHSECGRRIGWLGFFNNTFQLQYIRAYSAGIDNTVTRGFARQYIFYTEYAAAIF